MFGALVDREPNHSVLHEDAANIVQRQRSARQPLEGRGASAHGAGTGGGESQLNEAAGVRRGLVLRVDQIDRVARALCDREFCDRGRTDQVDCIAVAFGTHQIAQPSILDGAVEVGDKLVRAVFLVVSAVVKQQRIRNNFRKVQHSLQSAFEEWDVDGGDQFTFANAIQPAVDLPHGRDHAGGCQVVETRKVRRETAARCQ